MRWNCPPQRAMPWVELGMLKGGGGALASYLLFEPGFVQSLIAMGESDAFARKAELLAFFADI
jgi:NTE family protein